MGWAYGRIQVCWVWQLTRLTFSWTQHEAEPKCVGSSSLSDPYLFELSIWSDPNKLGLVGGSLPDPCSAGLNTWSNSSTLGLAACWTYIWLSSIWPNISKLGLTVCQTHVLHWLSTWSKPSMFGLAAQQAHIHLDSTRRWPKNIRYVLKPHPAINELPLCYWTFLDRDLSLFTKRKKYRFIMLCWKRLKHKHYPIYFVTSHCKYITSTNYMIMKC